MNKQFVTLLVLLAGVLHVPGLTAATSVLWQKIDGAAVSTAARPAMKLAPDKYAHFLLDESSMKSVLTTVPTALATATVPAASVTVPLPNGEIIELFVEESSIMEAALAAQFPTIKTFAAYRAGGAAMVGRLDFTEQGFHAMFSTEQGLVFVDPRTDSAGGRTYISYFKHDYNPADKDPRDMIRHPPINLGADNLPAPLSAHHGVDQLAARSGSQLTTYRLALAATGEYTAFHGGTIGGALSAMTTTMNRVNFIYQRDLSIRMVLVGNNSSIIYTDAATDPYSNNNAGALLTENQSNLNAVIGSANYDIGHVFGTGGGGLAALRVPCGSSKARGETGSSNPVGDPFDIDYVAHEMGHQFGGNHTFNGTTDNCGGGNRNGGTAWEPGSGTTIMAYAGICGAEDLQANSDSLFHAGSINEIIAFTTSGGGQLCGTRTATGNTAPVANAGADYTIPANTPFVLTGSASDVNPGNTLTFSWDEIDIGNPSSSPATMVDDGTRPLFRSFVPSASPVRYFPKLSSLLANTSDIGERLPTTTRNLHFRLTARDQNGGVHDDDVTVAVTAAAGPFAVTAPNGGNVLSSTTTVTWSVANTTSAPVSCANVTISLSTDGGNSFPTTLLASAPNNGSAAVVFPGGSSSTARVKVQCANNIFFDISNANFSYTSTAPTAPTISSVTAGRGKATVSFSVPGGNPGGTVYTAICVSATGASPRQNTGSTSPIVVSGLSGGASYTCSVQATNGGVTVSSAASSPIVPLRVRGNTPTLMLLLD